jgi:hypothetical protein
LGEIKTLKTEREELASDLEKCLQQSERINSSLNKELDKA